MHTIRVRQEARLVDKMTASQIQAVNPSTSSIVEEKGFACNGLMLVQELLAIALNVSEVDKTANEASASAPSLMDAEARKWHEVSIRALSWTRSALAAQQDATLKQLQTQAKIQMGKSDTSSRISVEQLEHLQEQAMAPSKPRLHSLPADAKPSGPPGVWILPKEPFESPKEPCAEQTLSQIGGSASAAFAAAGLDSVGSLREDLELLRQYDSERCLIVRRIKRLGLSSPDVLRKHFEDFGEVTEVLAAHSFERKSAKCRCDRIRPAALGFIVMGTAEAAQEIVRAGPTIAIGDVEINIKRFEAFQDDEE